MIELQQAIYESLINDSNLTPLLSIYTYDSGDSVPSIFEHLPQTNNNELFPAIVIDYPVVNQLDTDTENGFECTVLIHTWSVERGNKQVSDIQRVVYNRLHRAQLTVDNYLFSGISQEFAEILKDPDGISRHGIQRFKIFIELGEIA